MIISFQKIIKNINPAEAFRLGGLEAEDSVVEAVPAGEVSAASAAALPAAAGQAEGGNLYLIHAWHSRRGIGSACDLRMMEK